MASEIYFEDSMGGSELLTDFNWLKEKVFSGDDLFWEGATGQTALSYLDEKVSSSLIAVGGRAHGYALEHRHTGEKTQTLRQGEHNGEIVEVVIGGEPSRYFKEYFVSRETAWRAIEYFLKSGERDPGLTWERAEYPKQSWED